MKLFFIADIHGNYYALRRILEFAEKINSDLILCTGDISGYFLGINESIELLQKYNVISILGNHDAMLLGYNPISQEALYYPSFIKTSQIISRTSFEWLKKLNYCEKFTIGEKRFKLYHGGPMDIMNQYIYPDELKLFIESFNDADIYIFGHSHLQFYYEYRGKIFMNPGSVGLPRNGDFRVHGISYDTISGLYEFHKITYDINTIISKSFNNGNSNNIFLHNIHFGRSSIKRLKNNQRAILNCETVDLMKRAGIIFISTNFGAIMWKNDSLTLDCIMYIAYYENNQVELTSSAVVLKWQNKQFDSGFPFISDDFKLGEDSAGFYLIKLYHDIAEFENKVSDIVKAFEIFYKLKKYNEKI